MACCNVASEAVEIKLERGLKKVGHSRAPIQNFSDVQTIISIVLKCSAYTH